tara:strand:- start:533 stop:727 length:195 start_codon:yes stop_codon:yes gene_type:complete
MNIEQLYETLEKINWFYREYEEHNKINLKEHEILLTSIDNKIDDLKDLLYDAIEEGLKDLEEVK